MPIRFRCAYCNQLLGIARRKAGTVVRCPTCAGQVVVPTVGADDAGEEEKSPVKQPVFERSDFADLFESAPAVPAAQEPRTGGAAPEGAAGGTAAGTEAPPAPAPRPGAGWGTHADPDVEREPLGVPHGSPGFEAPRAAGLVLSPARATILTVAVVIGLAVAFAAGLLVGRFLLGAS
jgi:hypothetical protein